MARSMPTGLAPMWSFVLLVEADKAQWLGQTEGSDT
jgi:hypothetical protein